MSLISLANVSKAFGDQVLLRGASLAIDEGERVGLLGSNGSGKSTLLRILAGLEPPDSGTRDVRRDLQLGYLEQDPALDPAKTMRGLVREGLAARERVLAELERLHEELAAATAERLPAMLARHARLELELSNLGGHDVEHRVESTLHCLGLTDFDALCGRLSGGERRRVALARLLLGRPELLLLDEPTNHLDAFVIDWLEDWFLETKTPLLMVTHDRYFLDRVVDRIIELDRGELVPYAGGYGAYLETRAARLDAERGAESARQNLLRRETAWMRRGAPARTTKARARIKRFEVLASNEPIALAPELEFAFSPDQKLGSRVLELSGVAKRYGEGWVVPPLDLELLPGARLGVVGPNGAGKTTLLKIILGEIEPDAGSRRVGETVRFMGIDQLRTDLDPRATVREAIAGRSDVLRVGERIVRVESFLDRFGFSHPSQCALVAQLSGGERNRLLLAKLLCKGGNVLVLDEPTNDLDLATLRTLEEALLSFSGASVIVSHDRWFLDRVATQILHLDRRGRAHLHHGDMSSLLERLARESTLLRESAPPARAQTQKAAADPSRRKRITPWQQKELGELEERIPGLEAQIAELDARLSEPALYSGPRAALVEVHASRSARAAELALLYVRWEALVSIHDV